jgi:hypothetical protein
MAQGVRLRVDVTLAAPAARSRPYAVSYDTKPGLATSRWAFVKFALEDFGGRIDRGVPVRNP